METIEPQYQKVGRKPVFDSESLKQLDEFLQKHADATLIDAIAKTLGAITVNDAKG